MGQPWRVHANVPLPRVRSSTISPNDRGQQAPAIGDLVTRGREAIPDPSPVTTPSETLIAAVELVADTVEGVQPRAVRKRLLTGLVHDLGMHAAVLWTRLGRDEGLQMLQHVGLSGELATAFETWPAGSTADRIARTTTAPARLAISHAPVRDSDLTLYLMALPAPATELLGVLAVEPIDEAFVRLLASLGRAYASAVRQADLVRDNQHIVDSMVGDLRPADVVLPDGYDIGSLYRSATTNVAIGGDLYDWFCTDGDHLSVAIGDVSGKGIHAANRTAMAVHSLRALALPGASPHLTAQMLNTIMADQIGPESFVTLTYARLEPRSGVGEYVLAGHPPPILLRASGADVPDVVADLPLGVDSAATFLPHEITLEPGDRLVLYTDGVTESRAAHAEDELLETSGLVRLVEGLRDRSPQEIADAVWEGIQQFTAGDTTDDCAVLVLGRAAP